MANATHTDDLLLAERHEQLAATIERLTLDDCRDKHDRGRVHTGDLRLMLGVDDDLDGRMGALLPDTFTPATNLPGLNGGRCWVSETLLAAASRLGPVAVIFVADQRDGFEAYLADMWSYYNGRADPAQPGHEGGPEPHYGQVRAKYRNQWVDLIAGPDRRGYYVVESPLHGRERVHRALLAGPAAPPPGAPGPVADLKGGTTVPKTTATSRSIPPHATTARLDTTWWAA